MIALLNDSIIYRFLFVLKNTVVCYFINSKLYSLFLHGISVSKAAKEGSMFLRFYNRFKRLLDASWLSSVTGRCFNSFFKLVNKISFVKTVKTAKSVKTFNALKAAKPETSRTAYAVKAAGKTDITDSHISEGHFGEGYTDRINFTDSSKLVSIIDKLFRSLIRIDCRTVGLFLLAFSATGLILQLSSNKYGSIFTFAEVFLLVAAVILIFIGRPLLSLYEGSWIAKKFAGFFKG